MCDVIHNKFSQYNRPKRIEQKDKTIFVRQVITRRVPFYERNSVGPQYFFITVSDKHERRRKLNPNILYKKTF